MCPRDQLTALYASWRRLTEEEGDAIDAGDWERVSACQSVKLDLQAQIIETSATLQHQWESSPGQRMQQEPAFRQLVEELILLEGRNAERIASRRHEAEQHQQTLEKSNRSLRQIQRLYGGPRDESWNSYS